jgi:hypothetical protein
MRNCIWPPMKPAAGFANCDDNIPSSYAIVASRMEHSEILWNATIKEWFYVRCGRTSDHVTKNDAEEELAQFDFSLPDVTDNDSKENTRHRSR